MGMKRIVQMGRFIYTYTFYLPPLIQWPGYLHPELLNQFSWNQTSELKYVWNEDAIIVYLPCW